MVMIPRAMADAILKVFRVCDWLADTAAVSLCTSAFVAGETGACRAPPLRVPDSEPPGPALEER